MMYEIEIIRSSRRTVSLEVRKDLRVIVRAPFGVTDKEIEKFTNDKSDWILKHLEAAKARKRDEKPRLTDDEIRELAENAKEDIPLRVKEYAAQIGVTVGRITVRNQKTLWGSCSAKGNLNFNCLLMLCPEEIRDYVVVHELCHRIELNHSPRFWAQVERILPDYKSRRKWLKDNGGDIIGRMG